MFGITKEVASQLIERFENIKELSNIAMSDIDIHTNIWTDNEWFSIRAENYNIEVSFFVSNLIDIVLSYVYKIEIIGDRLKIRSENGSHCDFKIIDGE